MSENPNDVKPRNAEAMKYRKRANAYRDQVKDLEAKLAEALREKEALASLPDDRANRIAELESQIRTRGHKDAFAKLAKDKIRPEALEDAFALSGWKVEADDIDENKMSDVIAQLAEAKPYLAVAEAAKPSKGEETPSPQSVRLNPASNGPLPKPVSGLGRGPSPESNSKPKKNPQKI